MLSATFSKDRGGTLLRSRWDFVKIKVKLFKVDHTFKYHDFDHFRLARFFNQYFTFHFRLLLFTQSRKTNKPPQKTSSSNPNPSLLQKSKPTPKKLPHPLKPTPPLPLTKLFNKIFIDINKYPFL